MKIRTLKYALESAPILKKSVMYMKYGMRKKLMRNSETDDPERVARDIRAADRAAEDHTGQWLFYLWENGVDGLITNVPGW